MTLCDIAFNENVECKSDHSEDCEGDLPEIGCENVHHRRKTTEETGGKPVILTFSVDPKNELRNLKSTKFSTGIVIE